MPDLTPFASMPLAADANISDEIARSGMGFGALVERTGAAVAATQLRLDTSSAATASALASTLVNVIAVQEKVYRDDGTLDQVRTHVRPMPLISVINPVFYQWTSVRLQGMFYAREFAASGSSSDSSSSSSSGFYGSGISMILGPGALVAKSSSVTTETTFDQTSDVSFGRIRASALLEPRHDISIPKPNQAIRGPRLALISGAIEDIDQGRTMSMLVQYNRRDGTPIAGRVISIETEGLPWTYVGGGTTNASGRVEILLRRDFLDEDVDTSPASFVISARIGLVQNSVTVTF